MKHSLKKVFQKQNQMNEKNLSPEIIVVSDKKNAIEYKAMAFISEQTKTTFNYEIKRVRALWDPTLSIPGTGRRGGWRCPIGTRYGGQITDRFGRNCGWGVARRLANAITSIGDRLENRDDERRNRRVERRNARMLARLQQDERGGALERGARNIAERLEGGVAPTEIQRGEGRLQRIFGDDGPLRVGPVRMPRERQDRQPRRQPQQRRPVQREIEQPTTPQNEEQTPVAPERPARPATARRRRGQAQTDAVAPEDAPMPNESFDDYKNRKYEEYKSRIEKIQQEGGNAGLLTQDEWFKFNEGNLREAYNRVNNVPDAERPAPKPRNRAPRRRRVNASDARAQESANRRPRVEDRPVPEEPQPKPSRRVSTPRPLVVEPDPNFGNEPRVDVREPDPALERMLDEEDEIARGLSDRRRADENRQEDLGGSIPDARSERNVRNRFRERGLPSTAYWRADDYAGDDKAELERRFGRYYDANNQRNARGDFVNNRIQEGDGQPAPKKPAPRKQPPAAPQQPGNSDNAARSEELRQNREAMAQAAIEDARQRADNAENAVNARMPSDEVERQRQIAELRKLVSEVERNLDQMERNGARDAIVREEQRRRDALLNRIGNLQNTRTRDLDGAIITQEPAPAITQEPAPAPRRPRRQGAARSRRNARSSQNNQQQPASQQVPNMNRAKDRHDAVNLPKLANGKFDEVPRGNKGINTEADAKAYQGSIADVPDQFLDVAVIERSADKTIVIQAMFGKEERNLTPAERNRFGQFAEKVKAVRTGRLDNNGQPIELTAEEKQMLKNLRNSGKTYYSFHAGSGGANPTFHLYIDENGNIDGRGYLLKPPDFMFGLGAQHAELMGSELARRMGFAQGQGRIIPKNGSTSILIELGPNFAEGKAEEVGKLPNGSNAVSQDDRQSRLGAYLLNAILGSHDRHGRNGMVFRGNGALPIDFGRAFYFNNNTPQSMIRYMNSEYTRIDGEPLKGYRDRLAELTRSGRTAEQARAEIREELRQTLNQWTASLQQAFDDGTMDALQQRIPDGGIQRVTPVRDRNSIIQQRIAMVGSEAMLDALMNVVVPRPAAPRARRPRA